MLSKLIVKLLAWFTPFLFLLLQRDLGSNATWKFFQCIICQSVCVCVCVCVCACERYIEKRSLHKKVNRSSWMWTFCLMNSLPSIMNVLALRIIVRKDPDWERSWFLVIHSQAVYFFWLHCKPSCALKLTLYKRGCIPRVWGPSGTFLNIYKALSQTAGGQRPTLPVGLGSECDPGSAQP
jgi:hypothetical protein